MRGEIPSLEGGNVREDGRINLEKLKYIPMDYHERHLRSRIKPLDILMVKDGATTGKVTLLPHDFPYRECNINEHLFLIRIGKKNVVRPWFLYGYLQSQLGQAIITREITGGGQKGITKQAVSRILVPIPSLDIQKKIENQVKEGLIQIQESEKEIEKISKSLRHAVLDPLFNRD